jgi:sugar phosphate isomerase/epimerase
MSLRTACQCITFGDNLGDRLTEILPHVQAGGYEGIELGFRHIRHIPPAALRAQLETAGQPLVAAHIGGNLEDAGQAAGEREILAEILDYLDATGTPRLMYSGLKHHDEDQFEADFAMLNRAAQRCEARGVRLLYHNHDWEFADGGRVMNAILERGDAALGLCPDLGWVHKGGEDVLAFLERARPRIGAVHFKDFATRAPGLDTVVLGSGCVPLREAAAWLRERFADLRVVAEQDTAEGDPADAVRANGAFLRSVIA